MSMARQVADGAGLGVDRPHGSAGMVRDVQTAGLRVGDQVAEDTTLGVVDHDDRQYLPGAGVDDRHGAPVLVAGPTGLQQVTAGIAGQSP